MVPVVCKIKTKTVLSICFLFCVGVALLFVNARTHFFPRFLTRSFPHFLGWTLIVISSLAVLVLKSIRVDDRGIHAVYIFGITRTIGFHEVSHLVAKMNLAPLSMSSRISNHQRHQIIITPSGGKMRINISSTNITNFMDLYNVLLHTFQARMEVVDKRGGF